MDFRDILIANRGEIAIRVAQAAAELGIKTTAVFSADDAGSLHLQAADRAMPLAGTGARAYLDIEALIALARDVGCDAIHPGYGFLSEKPAFARACEAAKITFIGPSPEALEALGDKAKARTLAAKKGVPVLQGTRGAADLSQMHDLLASLPRGAALMIKSVAGGGGRGLRIVREAGALPAAFAAASREAAAAFGDGALYGERLIERARHIEVQVAGDRTGVLAIGDRDCSLQRRHQKLVEIAPAPEIGDTLRRRLHEAAVTIAASVRYRTVGTIEFLLDLDAGAFAFIEANARLQVEHTITEEVTGLDLAQIQIRLAAGADLASLGLTETPAARGFAIQARVNMETLSGEGNVEPSSGVISVYEPPTGPGIRIDGCGYGGYAANPNYDSLLAKVIVRGPTLKAAAARAERALSRFRIEGLSTNTAFLRAVLSEPAICAGAATTRFIEDYAGELLRRAKALAGPKFDAPPAPEPSLAIELIEGAAPAIASLQATVSAIAVSEGDLVRVGQELAILEAMKMEHVVAAPTSGRVVRLAARVGEVVARDQPILFIAPEESAAVEEASETSVDLDEIRPDLGEVLERWRITRDEARPEAVERRRRRGQRTARENIDDLIDPGTFLEYGAFALAAQRRRHSVENLLRISPADGLVCGVGAVNGALFPPERARCAALAYDFTVLAGTQGTMNHKKTDRLLEIVADQELPVVWFAEGGGGRPGDTDGIGASGLATPSFKAFAKLAGVVPKIAVVSGRCFAGNASFAGLCEILICTEKCNIGMGGPAMIEGGGLGVFAPEDIGPMAVQTTNGVVDILAADEAEATSLAKRALSYFQGAAGAWTAADQRLLRRAAPENRLRVYDVRRVIETLADEGSFLEIRPRFGPGLITGFIRLEGRPMGLIANDPNHLGGAIDCDGADKSSRLFQLCEAFDLPVLSLIDTPGFMVGPDSEAQAAVRKTSRMFINGARLGTPMFAVVLRKAYGLGAQAMAGGSTLAPVFCASWPTGEFGGMGLEGAVRLGYRRELEAQTDPSERKALFERLLAGLYGAGKAINVAASLEIDAVIDPADTRKWILQGLRSCLPRRSPARRFVDAW